MRVADLIAELQKCNPEAEVIVYSEIDEGAAFAHEVISGAPYEARPYVKADWPDAYKRFNPKTQTREWIVTIPGEKVIIA